MAEGRRFTLDDIIAEQVKKQVLKLGTGGGSGGGIGDFGIKDIGDITKLLTELNKLGTLAGGKQEQKATRGVPQGESGSINAEQATIIYPEQQKQIAPPPIKFDVPRLVDNFIKYIPMVIVTYGDLKLSEVQVFLEKDKESVVKAVEGMIQGALT